jgi:hypothetical protein
MGEEKGCGNRKSDVASLGRKLKFHLLVYIIDSGSMSYYFPCKDERTQTLTTKPPQCKSFLFATNSGEKVTWMIT